METTLLLTIVSIAAALTINSDFGRIYNGISKFLFDGQSNICRY